VVRQGTQLRVLARDVGRAAHQDTVRSVLNQVVALRVDLADAVRGLAPRIDVVGDDRVADGHDGTRSREATSIADPIPVGICRIVGYRHVIQAYRGRVRGNPTPVGGRGIAADRAVRDVQRAIGHRDGAAAHAAGEVPADGRAADRRSAHVADPAALGRCRAIDDGGARYGAAAKEDAASVRLRHVAAHDAARYRKGAANRDAPAVQHGRVPADGAAIDRERGTGGGGHGDAAALAARVVTTDEAADPDVRTGATA